MAGRVREAALPSLYCTPDPSRFREHSTEDGRRVFILDRVLYDLGELERAEHPCETAGLLFGGHFTDGKNHCTVVSRLEKPYPGEVLGTPTTVTITAAGAERMTARARAHDPWLAPVGWGHTHPRFEAYFSAVDRREQRVWQQPGAVGLVISGLCRPTDRYRVFVGPEATLADPQADGQTQATSPIPRADGNRGRRHRPTVPTYQRVRATCVQAYGVGLLVLATLAIAISLHALTAARDAGRTAGEALVKSQATHAIEGSAAPNSAFRAKSDATHMEHLLEFQVQRSRANGGLLGDDGLGDATTSGLRLP
jgi:proteasome lid subunit RPN8/RPN11